MQILPVPVQLIKSQPHFGPQHPIKPQASLPHPTPTITRGSQSRISMLFINPINCSCSSLPQTPNTDATIQPESL